jgi:hypothetical protein
LRILADPEKTEVVYGSANMIEREIAAFPDIREKVDGCYDYSGPSALVTTELVWNATKDLTRRGIRLRYITDITTDNVSYCKQLLECFELRHLNGAKGNFGIADGIDCVIHSVLQEEQVPIQAIFTNVKSFVEAQQYLFDTLWMKAIPAKERIREIEEGLKPDFIETLSDPSEIQRLGFELVKSAKQEILLLFSTANSLLRQEHAGLVQLLTGIGSETNVKIRILTHINDDTREL